MNSSSSTENNNSDTFIPKIVNVVPPNINVALHKAAAAGNLEDVKHFIDSGASINFKNTYHFSTPLIEASLNGHETVVDYLIFAGADLNIVDEEKNSALIFACKGGYLPIVKSLILAGADKDIQDVDGNTGIISAAFRGYESIVNELINAGANLNIKDNRRQTAIMIALENGHQSIVDSLNRGKLRTQSQIEKDFRVKLISLDPTIKAAISAGTDVDKQIIKNIDIDQDYMDIISRFVSVNIGTEDKVLIADYENIAHASWDKNIKNNDGIRLKPTPKNKDVLFPNVEENEIDYYRIATFFILNYA